MDKVFRFGGPTVFQIIERFSLHTAQIDFKLVTYTSQMYALHTTSRMEGTRRIANSCMNSTTPMLPD